MRFTEVLCFAASASLTLVGALTPSHVFKTHICFGRVKPNTVLSGRWNLNASAPSSDAFSVKDGLANGIRASGIKPSTLNTNFDLLMENMVKLSDGDMTNIEFVYGPDENYRRGSILEKAYEECERITGIFAKTFYLGTKFMSLDARKAVWAIYVWCRRTDDIVDGPRAMVRGKRSLQKEFFHDYSIGKMEEFFDWLTDNDIGKRLCWFTKDLDAWTQRLEDIFVGKARDALDLALVDVKIRYPTLAIRPFKDMVGGMLMDVPGAGKSRYETFNELEEYCYRVAGTVGLMTLPVLGTANGISEEQAKEPALSLGIALQLTNILRDVGEDAVRGRIYLPLEDLAKFDVPEDNINNGILDDNYRKLMAFQIARTRYYYAKAAKGIPMLAPESRLPVQASLDMYGKILTSIEENGYDNFRKRAYVSKTQKLMTIPSSWWKSTNPPQLSELEEIEKKLERDSGLVFRLTRFDLIPDDQFN